MINRKIGFVLGELVVMLVCVVLLVLIFLPAQSRARQQAKNITCLANLHRIGQVFGTYTADYDGYFNPGWWYSDGNGLLSQQPGGLEQVMWFFATRNYYQDPEILLCPKNTLPDLDSPEFEFSNNDNDPWGPVPWMPKLPILGDKYAEYGSAYAGKPVSGYCANDWLGTLGVNTGEEQWERMQTEGANEIPMVLDGGWYSGAPYDFAIPPQDPDDKVQTSQLDSFDRFVFSRHRGGTQAVFMDLSVRRVGVKELWRLKWHRQFDTANDAATNPPYPWPEWIEALPE